MTLSVQKYKVSLFGEAYALVSDEAESDLVASAHLVDTLMKEVAQKTHCNDVKQLAILVALHLAQQKINDQSKLMSLIDDELKSVEP